MSEKETLSKFELYFLALVCSGAVPLEKVEPEYKTAEGGDLYYVPERRVIAKNLRQLQELELVIRPMVHQIERGGDPLKLLDA